MATNKINHKTLLFFVGNKCCKKCFYDDRNYVSGFGESYKTT